MSLFEKNIVGIEFHDYAAQVVELSLDDNKIILESYNRVNIPPNIISNGEIVKKDQLKGIIKNLLETSNPKPIINKEIAVVFPSAKVFHHIFKFPVNLNDKEIRKSLPYEAETVIPFSIQDMYWDFTVLEAEDKNVQHASKYVLFTAITKGTADRYTELIQSIGLTPFLFGTNAEALKYGILKQLNSKSASLIIEVSTLSTNYLVIKDNIIKHFFSSNQCGKELLEKLSAEFQIPQEVINKQIEYNKIDPRLLPEIEQFIDKNYSIGLKIIEAQSKVLGPINEVFLTGEFLNLPRFYDLAKEKFIAKNVAVGDPKKYLSIDSKKFNPLNSGSGSAQYSTYFMNVVGISLRGLLAKSEQGINLLPDSLRKNLASKKNSLFISIAAIFMAFLSLFAAAFMFSKHQNLSFARSKFEVQRQTVDKVIYGTRYQEIRESIESFNREVSELKTINDGLFSLPSLLDAIKAIMPRGIEVTQFEFLDSKLSLKIVGVADNREVLLETTKNLKEADFIEEVITPISNFDEKYKISFSMELKLLFKNLPGYGSNTDA